MSESTHVLYRFFTNDDQLLYVGITCNPGKRFQRHRGEKSWWDDVARIEFQQYPNRESLRAAERRAIAEESPLYNIRLNATGTQSEPPRGKLRRGLELGRAYAIGLSNGECLCGLIDEADDEGFVLSLLDWIVGSFCGPKQWVSFDAVERWLRAESMCPPRKGDPWPDGVHRPDKVKIVYEMDPLADFQAQWTAKRAEVPA